MNKDEATKAVELQIAPFKKARLAAAKVANPAAAARRSGSLAVVLEERVHDNWLNTPRALRHTNVLWENELLEAANNAGWYYRQLAINGNYSDASLRHFLIAQEYFELAARVAKGSRREELKKSARRCGEDFDHWFPKLSGEDRERALFTKVAKQLNLARINSADYIFTAKLDGQSAKDRQEKRLVNCQRVVVATIATLLTGKPYPAQERVDVDDFSAQWGKLQEAYGWAYGHGGRFEEMTVEQIGERLRLAGPGSAGIVSVHRPGESGHVTTVANIDGLCLNIEGQVESVGMIRGNDLPGEEGASYSLLMVKDANHDELEIDEVARANQLMQILNDEKFRTDEHAYLWDVTEKPCPDAVHKAVLQARKPRSGVPENTERSVARKLAQLVGRADTARLGTAAQNLGRQFGIPVRAWGDSPPHHRQNQMIIDYRTVEMEPGQTMLVVGGDGAALITKPDGFVVTETLGDRAGITMGAPQTTDQLWAFDLSGIQPRSIQPPGDTESRGIDTVEAKAYERVI